MEKPPPIPTWTRAEDDAFETALVSFPDGIPERWRMIAGAVTGKSPEDVENHYDALVDDVIAISSGLVPLPDYNDQPETKRVKIEVGKKKGKAWSEKEHLLFLEGLARFGKGDWRSISRNVVKSKTATQVASHAQKYFNRQNAKNKGRRTSIHDLTLGVANPVSDASLMQISNEDNKFGYDENLTNMDCNQEELFVTNSDSISLPSQVANHRGFSQGHDNSNSGERHLYNGWSLRARIPGYLISPSARFPNRGGAMVNGHPSNKYFQGAISEYDNFTMLRNKLSGSTLNQFTIDNNGPRLNLNGNLVSPPSQFSPNGAPMVYYRNNINGQSTTPPPHLQHMNSHMGPHLPNSQTTHTPHRSLYMGHDDTHVGSYAGLCDNQVEASDADNSNSLPDQSPNEPKQANP